jgi:hypothetical protein
MRALTLHKVLTQRLVGVPSKRAVYSRKPNVLSITRLIGGTPFCILNLKMVWLSRLQENPSPRKVVLIYGERVALFLKCGIWKYHQQHFGFQNCMVPGTHGEDRVQQASSQVKKWDSPIHTHDTERNGMSSQKQQQRESQFLRSSSGSRNQGDSHVLDPTFNYDRLWLKPTKASQGTLQDKNGNPLFCLECINVSDEDSCGGVWNVVQQRESLGSFRSTHQTNLRVRGDVCTTTNI